MASRKQPTEAAEATEPADPPYAYYLGDGTVFIAGAPARDLSRAEWDALDRATQDLCLATELYKLTTADIAPAEEVPDGR